MPIPARLFPTLLCLAASSAFAEVAVKKLDDRVRVEIDGKLFTEMRYTGAPHIYYWPLIGPGGAKMTRSWPMEDVPGEEHDHPHHRSLWFAHGLVNGFDFWSEQATYGTKSPKFPLGQIVLDKIVKAEGGRDSGEIVSTQKWEASDGSVPVIGTQRLVVYSTPESERQFDFENTLTAGAKDAVFGETKEGSAAMRIAETMRTRQPKGKTAEGHILNSEGIKDVDVWGKKADWVAMSGPIDGKTFTIAIFDHPKNLRHPTRWHARDYGLFAANPFGGSQMDKTEPKDSGNYTLKAGETMTLNYRILVLEGDADAAKLKERYAAYAAK